MRTTSAFQPKPPIYLRDSTHSLDLESGSSQYAYITNANQTGIGVSGDFTIEAWVKPESYSSAGSVIASKDTFPASGNDRSYLFYIMEGGADTGKLSCVYWASGNSNETNFRTTNVATTLGTWTHIAVTVSVSTTTATFYVNGVSVASSKIGGTATTLANNAVNFNIGRRNGTSTLYFDGLIDDVRVWNDVRTAQEIQDNYLVGLVGNEANLVGYWKFNNNYLDETSNNNDLTASGSPVFSSTDIPFSTSSNTTKAYYPLNGQIPSSLNTSAFAYWKMEDTSDSVGSNTLTNSNVTFSTGKINNGAVFNGTSSAFTFPTVPATGANTWSASVWFKTSVSGASKSISYWGTNVSLQGVDIYMNSSNKLATNFYGGGSQVVSTASVNDNAWHHAVVTCNGSALTLYLDGSSQGTGASVSPNIGTTNKFIGKDSGGGNWWSGSLDEFGLWSKELSASEVTELYNSGSGKQLDLRAKDYSGNGNHGTETAITYVQGKFGQCAKFNGTSSRITNTFFADPDTYNSGLTISGWTYVDTNQNGKMFWHFVENGAWGAIYAQMQSGKYEVRFGSGSVGFVLDSGVSTKLGKWVHICMTHDTSNNIVYIDGRRANSQTSQTLANTSTTLYFGYDSASAYLNGMIDEVIIESRAWTAKEVESYYQRSVKNYKPQGLWSSISTAVSNFFQFF